jgi:exonuclease SbcD
LRIVHVADTHLGYSAYRKVCDDDGPFKGLNQREVDTYLSFQAFVDRVIELRPDAVLHSGDLFDSVRPSNRALGFALEQLIRLSDADIPVVIIAGNHSTPRIRETGSVFRLFEHLPNVMPVYKGMYERIQIGDLTTHAIPHVDGEAFKEMLPSLERCGETTYEVSMLHAGVVGLKDLRMNEFNEQLVDSCYLRKEMDYIAMGHFHQYCDITSNAAYSGSTEHFSFIEAGQPKGFLYVDLEAGKKRFMELPTRPMVDLPAIDGRRLDAPSLMAEIESRLNRDLEGMIVRLVVRNVPRATYEALDFQRIRELASDAMHFEPRFEIDREKISIQAGGATISSLEQEFVSYLKRYPIENMDKDALRAQGLEYLKRRLETSS